MGWMFINASLISAINSSVTSKAMNIIADENKESPDQTVKEVDRKAAIDIESEIVNSHGETLLIQDSNEDS